jgi:hypothetical protein
MAPSGIPGDLPVVFSLTSIGALLGRLYKIFSPIYTGGLHIGDPDRYNE